MQQQHLKMILYKHKQAMPLKNKTYNTIGTHMLYDLILAKLPSEMKCNIQSSHLSVETAQTVQSHWPSMYLRLCACSGFDLFRRNAQKMANCNSKVLLHILLRLFSVPFTVYSIYSQTNISQHTSLFKFTTNKKWAHSWMDR